MTSRATQTSLPWRFPRVPRGLCYMTYCAFLQHACAYMQVHQTPRKVSSCKRSGADATGAQHASHVNFHANLTARFTRWTSATRSASLMRQFSCSLFE
eukprot:1847849-Amphidinium_carterae.1